MASPPQVVWVAQWYPHNGEPYAGDFIQRHASAVALYTPVHVFACFPFTCNRQDENIQGNLRETVIYFKPIKTGNRILDKILLWKRWKQLLQKGIEDHINEHGKPVLLHCHITLNAGWLGLWAKKRLNIPYVITEHWSGYMPGAVNGFEKYNGWSKRLFKKIIREAECVTTVSKALLENMQMIENECSYVRVPNVVDESVFSMEKSSLETKSFKLLHISTFNYQKNIPGMLAAFDKVKVTIPNIEFHIVGPKAKFQNHFPLHAKNSNYVLHGEIPQEQIARLMVECDACILYSYYETFGCVLIEANATGLPVIVSDIPVLREIVQSGKNGVLVPPDNPNALADSIVNFINQKNTFIPHQIALEAKEKYSYSVVGKQFMELYQSLVVSTKIQA